MIAWCVLLAGLVAVLAMVVVGLRAGDRPADVVLAAVGLADGRLEVTLVNPGAETVIAGMAVRRPGPRLLLEFGTYVSRPRRIGLGSLHLVTVEAQSDTTVTLPWARRRAELLVSVGQPGRLRRLHRLVIAAPVCGPARQSASSPSGGTRDAHGRRPRRPAWAPARPAARRRPDPARW